MLESYKDSWKKLEKRSWFWTYNWTYWTFIISI